MFLIEWETPIQIAISNVGLILIFLKLFLINFTSFNFLFFFAIFKKDGLCVNPTQSFVENIGHDGSGVHCIDSPAFKTGLSIEKHIKFSSRVEEDKIALNRIQEFYKKQRKSLFIRAINKLSRIAVVKNLIN